MTATSVLQTPVVTPAAGRKRVREQHLRGPVARPQRLAAPGGRPVQPVAPALAGAPVRLRRRAPRPAAVGGVQLTDRGLMLVISLIGLIVAATVVVGLVKFFGVSNAPLEPQHPTGAQPVLVADATQR